MSKFVRKKKKLKNLKKSQKIPKPHFKKNDQKNAIILGMLFKEIIIQPQLSIQPRFKIQGGLLSVTAEHACTKILVSNIGYP